MGSIVAASIMAFTYNELLFSVCFSIAERINEAKERYPKISEENVISCVVQAHQDTTRESLENWQAGVPCCSGCLSEGLFNLAPNGFSVPKKTMVITMYSDAFDILKAMNGNDILQTASSDTERFQDFFKTYISTHADNEITQ